MSKPVTDDEARLRARTPFNLALVEARAVRGMKAGHVALRTGFSVAYVRYCEENNINPTIGTMLRFASALNLVVTVSPKGISIYDQTAAVFYIEDWMPENGC